MIFLKKVVNKTIIEVCTSFHKLSTSIIDPSFGNRGEKPSLISGKNEMKTILQ